MLEAVVAGLTDIADPFRMGMLMLGVLLGLVVGIIPGIGGTVGLAILLPFIWDMDPHAAIAMLIGVVAITTTSDTITSVLLAIPGTSGSVATIVDGHPMARKGEAGRALSAGFFASAIGGVFGAIVLALSVPIVRPLVMQFGSPEFFMLCMLGIASVSMLSGRQPIKGLIAAGIGLLLCAIGGAPAAEYMRYTFGINYLLDGLPLIVVALGIFGLPEVVDFMIGGKPIAGDISIGKGALTGIRDTIRELPLVLRCSALGCYIGFIPGMGTTVANWIGYGHAVQSAKGKGNFGEGDVRGVLGPESANNAARGGELIPTLMFGVPGSGSMALMLVALMVLGISPGPYMLTKNLSLVFSTVWSLAIANVVGALICMLLARQLARIATMPIHLLTPFIIVIILLGAYQSTNHWGDLIALLGLGTLGWFMKHLEFSRPPLLVGFVLGGIAERYLWLTIQRYGASWLLHPWVIGIGVLTILSVVLGVRWQRRRATGNQERRGGNEG